MIGEPKMSILDILPYDICKAILSEWIDRVFDVDSALCNCSLRSKFLYCLRGCEINFPIVIKSIQKWDKLIRWNASRKAKLIKVSIAMNKKFERNIFEEINEVLPFVQNLTTVFNSLHPDWTIDIGNVLTQLTSLRSLDVVGFPASSQQHFPLAFTYLLPIVTGSSKHGQYSMLRRLSFQDVEFGSFHHDNHHNHFFDWAIVCCPHLEELLFFNCNGLPYQEIFPLVERLAHLKKFFYETKWPLSRWITDGPLPPQPITSTSLAKQVMSLHHPGLRDIRLASYSVSELLLRCPSLQTLSLHLSFLAMPTSFCQQMTTWGHLTTLEFLNSNWLNDDIMDCICIHCPQITSLSFEHCTHRLTTHAYQSIATYLSHLHTLLITELGITAIHQDLLEINLFQNAFDDAAIDVLCDTTTTTTTERLPLHTIRLDSVCRVTAHGYHRLLHENYFAWKVIDIHVVGNTRVPIVEEILNYFCDALPPPSSSTDQDRMTTAPILPRWYHSIESIMITFMHTFGSEWTLSQPWCFRHPTIQKIILVGVTLPAGNVQELKKGCPQAMIRVYPSANIVYIEGNMHPAAPPVAAVAPVAAPVVAEEHAADAAVPINNPQPVLLDEDRPVDVIPSVAGTTDTPPAAPATASPVPVPAPTVDAPMSVSVTISPLPPAAPPAIHTNNLRDRI